MGQRNSAGTDLHYYSERLKQKLGELRDVSAAIIEAPPGYGKTTAIRDFLEAGLSAPVYWFTAADEMPAAGFRRLYTEIDKIDSLAGQRLLNIEMPNAATIGEACDALWSIQCLHEAYLVIDNFQLLQEALPPAFFRALLEHGGKNLHIIILTNTLNRNINGVISSQRYLHITAADLRLNDGDIERYFTLAGLPITPKDAQEIARLTGGWMIAVYLQLCSFREKGTYADTHGLIGLMEHLVWGVLGEAQRTFLLNISPFKMFTLQQACSLNGSTVKAEHALEMLACPFIDYAPSEQRFEVHSILSKLLVMKRKERGVAFDHECLNRAGDYCREEGETAKALAYYFETGDYKRVLSLDLSLLTLETIGDKPFFDIARSIAQNCPYKVKKGNILSMLRVAWALAMSGAEPDFNALMKELRDMLDGKNGETASSLLGEWMLLSSLNDFPSLDKMTPILKQAAVLLKGNCSQVVLPTAPWCFGSYSQLAVYHIHPGEADREADALEEYIALYSKLTNGNGRGADVLYRAELCFHRGDFNNAEILAYKAEFLAKSKQQGIVHLGAAVLLGDIALRKADATGWQYAISSMEQAASYPGQNTSVARSTLDIARGMLFNELQKQRSIAPWLQNGEFSQRGVLFVMVPNALFVHLSYLSHLGEYARLIALGETIVPEGRKFNPLGNILVSLLFARSHLALDQREKALAFMEQAVELALKDGLYLLLSLFMQNLDGMVECCLKIQNPNALKEVRRINGYFMNGIKALKQEFTEEGLPEGLTRREQDVARLAAQSMRNADIAEALGISPNTVKAHLKAIYEKLAIDKRSRLREKLK